MKINLKKYLSTNPRIGQKRRKSGFLFFPKVIDGELRWLKYAAWIERYRYRFTSFGADFYGWEPEEWENNFSYKD